MNSLDNRAPANLTLTGREEAVLSGDESLPHEDAGTTLLRPRRTLWRILVRTWHAVSADNLSLLAAGVAFYALLAIFPAIAFGATLFGLLADPASVQQQVLALRDLLPPEAWNVISAQVLSLTSHTSTKLTIASAISLALALINARLAASAMMGALNVVYKREETRSFVATNAIAFAFTLGAMAMLAISIAAVVSVPQLLALIGYTQLSNNFIHTARWPILTVLMALGLAATYRYGPDGRQGHWRWLTLGSLVATLLWLIGSFSFSWYVQAFNSYNKLYGSLGAVVVLLYWLWVTAFAALMGAELDMQTHTVTSKKT